MLHNRKVTIKKENFVMVDFMRTLNENTVVASQWVESLTWSP